VGIEMNNSLIEALKLRLDIPAYHYGHQSLITNPLQLIMGMYHQRGTRTLKTLLDDLTFSIEYGDRVALIGNNGAGKTTLLHVLAQAYRPTAGRLVMNGKPTALFNLTLGFHNQASGIENIYLRSIAMGLSLEEVRDKIEGICSFSGLSMDVLSQPIHIFSNGMRLRLALAIATAVEPDILLLDEWIAAGDASFIDKAQARLESHIDISRCLVIASHNRLLLERLCNKGILLDQGRMLFYGPIKEALEHYDEFITKT
jgi:homopolymeric O-antigen transport system ATP-binding protein